MIVTIPWVNEDTVLFSVFTSHKHNSILDWVRVYLSRRMWLEAERGWFVIWKSGSFAISPLPGEVLSFGYLGVNLFGTAENTNIRVYTVPRYFSLDQKGELFDENFVAGDFGARELFPEPNDPFRLWGKDLASWA